MSGQKQNLLRLMIVCCVACQISCSKIMIVDKHLPDKCEFESDNKIPPNFKIKCESNCMEIKNNFCIMNVESNITPIEPCNTNPNKHSFNITHTEGSNYEVTMNETFKDIQLWFFSDEINCASSTDFLSCLTQTPSTTCNCKNKECKGCLKFPPVNVKEKCKKVPYGNNICNNRGGNRYILRLNETSSTCVTCENTPTYNLTDEHLKDSDNCTDPAKASDFLKKLKPEMENMKANNISKAQIVMGDVIGLLHVQTKKTETKDMCCFSDGDMINDFDCQNNLTTDIPWSVKFPAEAFNKSRLENNGSHFMVILRFKNMENKNQTKNYTILNNEVYGITMRANISNLMDNIEMFFTSKETVSKASCSSWDGKGKLEWTTSGCETEQMDNNTIKCSCSHLTFFAVLMSVPAANVTVTDLESLSFISSIGCGISMFFLAIALFMHFLLRKAKSNQATKILINMFVALFLLNLSFLSNESVANSGDKAACVFIALLMHYSMLATFTWFFIQALHLYLWLIRQNVRISNYIRKITVLGWVCSAPVVVVVVSIGGYEEVILHASSGKITRFCWITNPYIHYIVNIGYYILVFIFTAGIFIVIFTKIVEARHMRATDGKRKTFRKQLMMVLSLFLLFGLTWAVAFFSYGPMLTASYYIFTVLNSFQGFFLFVYYYHIHRDVAGHFSDDPKSSASTSSITQSNSNALQNVYN